MGFQGWFQVWSQGSRGFVKTWDQAKSLKFILIDSIFLLYPVLRPLVTLDKVFPQSFRRIFLFSKKSFSKSTLQVVPGVREMGDVRETPSPAPNYNTPVKDLSYKDLLTSTFTLVSHERGIKTWCVPSTYPDCVYSGKMYRHERFNVECHMDPNIGKATGKGRTVAPCKESLPTSCGPHRIRFLEVQSEIRARMASDKNTLLPGSVASSKRNLMSVGGCADTPEDLVAEGNSHGKRPCLGNGQTVLTRTPTQAEFVEWISGQ